MSKPSLRFSSIAACVLVFSTASCSLVRPDLRPDEIQPTQMFTRELLSKFSTPAWRATYDSSIGEEKALERNKILNELVFLSDLVYSDFENSLYGRAATMSTVVDMLTLSVTAAAAATGTAEVKAVLAGVAAVATGGKTIVEKNLYQEQSRIAIAFKMRELRKRKLREIYQGELAEVDAYPLEQGLIDIQQLGEAGTVVSALQSIANDAGKALDRENEEIQKLRSARMVSGR